MLNKIDSALNNITMYKLLLWGLRILAAIALVLSFTGVLHLDFKGLVLSLITLIVSCYAGNIAFARIFKVPTNTESYVITELILFLILPPAATWPRVALVAVAGVIAMASKFLINYRGKHIFNPAAFAAALFGLLGVMNATWWIGNSTMWWLVLILGLLVVRKVRRYAMFLTFVGVSLAVTFLTAIVELHPIVGALKLAVTSSPLLFLGSIMLTEPATMPSRQTQQIVYGGIVGLLYATGFSFGPFVMYPEVALLLGNIYAFAVSPRYRLKLTLERVEHISERVANYVFKPGIRPSFRPGQYMEWTLDHARHDSRGNRRTFSLASSPTEDTLQIGVKFYEPSSSFKKALRTLKPGATIYAGQLTGDFVLPHGLSEKLVFIAGGIGITPFRSMLKYIIDRKEKRDIILIYAVPDPREIAYNDILMAARSHGVRVIPLLASAKPPKGWEGKAGRITPEFVSEHIKDYSERTFYVSGPESMVQPTAAALKKLGIRNIRTDHFSGY